jgi:hypothetical protein
MANENVNILINSKADLKGFKEAETAATKLNKNIKTLATTLGAAYGARAVVNFGKSAVKAFAEDQAATAKLTNAVKNLGLAYANPQITKFISDLEKQSGIVDETLRPAFQALLTQTKDLAAAQTLLTSAIDISRGSGIDLATVTQDLANGYVGITRGLKKYNTGLTQAQLKSKSFAEVLSILNNEYAGASSTYLDTYAGKLDVLSVAADNAKESIGKGLIDAFARISGGSSVQDTVHTIETITGAINAMVTAVSFAVEGLVKLYKGLDFLTSFGGLTGANGKIAQKLNPKPATSSTTNTQATIAKTQIKASTALVKAQKTSTAELKKQAQLKKDGTVFDMEQIQLIAALKGKLSDDEQNRVKLQLALLNGNVEEADKLTKQILMAQDSTGNLYKYFLSIGDMSIKNPFAFLDTWLAEFQKKWAATLAMTNTAAAAVTSSGTYTPAGISSAIAALGVTAGYGANIPQTGTPSTVASTALGNGSFGIQTGMGNFVDTASVTGSNTNVRVYVQGNVVTEQDLIDAIQRGLQTNSLSGSPSSIGRIAGMFG